MRCLPRTSSATGTSVTRRPCAGYERPVPKKRFLTSCCVIVEPPRMRPPSSSSSAAMLDRVPIEAVVLVETSVLCGDHGVLKIRRDLAEWHEVVALMIRRAVNPRLQAALHVHRRGRRIDPPRSHEHQHSQRPQRHQHDEQPFHCRSKRDATPSGRHSRPHRCCALTSSCVVSVLSATPQNKSSAAFALTLDAPHYAATGTADSINRYARACSSEATVGKSFRIL